MAEQPTNTMYIDPRDPDYVGFYGQLTTKTSIGNADEQVTVTITFEDDEATYHEVKFKGVDVAGCLPETQLDELTEYFYANWDRIVRENKEQP